MIKEIILSRNGSTRHLFPNTTLIFSKNDSIFGELYFHINFDIVLIFIDKNIGFNLFMLKIDA